MVEIEAWQCVAWMIGVFLGGLALGIGSIVMWIMRDNRARDTQSSGS